MYRPLSFTSQGIHTPCHAGDTTTMESLQSHQGTLHQLQRVERCSSPPETEPRQAEKTKMRGISERLFGSSHRSSHTSEKEPGGLELF